MEEEYRTSSNFHHYINIIEIRITSATPNIHCRDDLGIYEFDREIYFFPMGLSQYLMVERLIRNVRIRRTRSGYATYKYKQHHRISPDLLAQE